MIPLGPYTDPCAAFYIMFSSDIQKCITIPLQINVWLNALTMRLSRGIVPIFFKLSSFGLIQTGLEQLEFLGGKLSI